MLQIDFSEICISISRQYWKHTIIFCGLLSVLLIVRVYCSFYIKLYLCLIGQRSVLCRILLYYM